MYIESILFVLCFVGLEGKNHGSRKEMNTPRMSVCFCSHITSGDAPCAALA